MRSNQRRNRWGLVVALVVTSTACSKCGENQNLPTGSSGGEGQGHPSVKLSPLPVAPQIQIQQEPGISQQALTVVVGRPTDTAYGDVHPTITFNKPVMALGTVAHEQAQAAVAQIEPALPGEWRWLGSASVEFVPKGLVPYSTSFKVTVPAGLKALDGTQLAQPYSYSFQTPAPSIQDEEPATGFNWLKADQVFTIIFDQAVENLAGSVTLKAGTQTIPVTVTAEVNLEEERRAKEKPRRYAREDDQTRGFKERRTRYELKAQQPLPLDSDVTLTIAGTLKGKEGPLTLGNESKFTYRTYGPMKLTGIGACNHYDRCSWGPLVIYSTNTVDPTTLKDKVEITPKVDVDWDRVETAIDYDTHQPYFTLPGRYKPGTAYSVKIAAGVQDEFKQTAAAFSGSATLANLDPDLNAGPNLALLEASGDGALPVQSTNIQSVNAKLWSLQPADMARLLLTRTLPNAAPTSVNLNVSGTKNLPRWSPLSVRDALFKGQKGGLFRASITTPELPTRSEQVIIGQITDLAVHAKVGPKSGLVWVTRLSNGSSVADANVALYDSTGAIKWQGKTGADGLAQLPGLEGLINQVRQYEWDYGAPGALVSATKDGDTGVTLTNWEGGLSPGAFELSSDWEGKKARSLGQVFSERGIYRPGDEVFIKGLMRFRSMGELKNPGANLPIKLTVTDSKGNNVFTQTAKTSRFGTFDAKFTLGTDAPLGAYGIDAVITAPGSSDQLSYTGSFRVEEYRAPQFQVDVSTEHPDVIAGEPLKATVISRYLFGGAMAGAKVHWTAVRNSEIYSPPGNAGFTFGAQTWWWDDREPEPTSDITSSGDGEADAQGNVVVDLGNADAPGGKTYTVTVEGEATDVNRQQVANRTTLTIHPAAVYAGVKAGGDEGFANAGKPMKLEIVAASPDGKRIAGQAVKVTFKRREWKSIRKKGVGGEWYTESEPVETAAGDCSVKTEATPVNCDYKPEQPGLYLVEASVTDDKGRTQTTRSSFYAIGDGWVSWQRNDTDRIDLVADKAIYDIGDTAKVLVKSPYPSAEAVLTTEREGVLSSRRVKLNGSATALEIPITESMVPNIYVGLEIARGRVESKEGLEGGADPGRPSTRFGYVELKVEKKTKRLSVTLTPDKPEAKPRDKVRVDIKVADVKNAGVPAEVTVWAVDEGVLRLTDYKVPDPVEALHPQHGLSVRIGEPLIHLVQRQLYGDKGQNSGGGGGDDASGAGIRNKFKTTALFMPSVITDASGIAHVDLELPDNLTTFRLMAVAVTETDRVGSGESKVTVSKKLMALPALPRLARVGDHFEAGVVVHTRGAEVSEAQVSVEAQGLKIEEGASKSVNTSDGRAHEVRFKFAAEQQGMATLRFKVAGGGEQDAVEQKLPVVLPVSMEAVATYGDTTDQRVEAVAPPGGIRPGIGGMDLTMSSTLLGDFGENMRQLIDYPYGCVEQMSSRLVPFVALRELYGKFGVAYPGPTDANQKSTAATEDLISRWVGKDALDIYKTNDPDEVVKRTVAAIQRLQNHDGGFRYWPAEGCSSDWASSYATLALARAGEVGYSIDANVVGHAKQFLVGLASGKCTPCMWGCFPPDDETRIFALYVLARTGAPQPSTYGEFYARRQKLPLFSQAMLADAMFVGHGDRTQAKQLLSELLNHAKETPRDVHFEETDPLSYATLWSSDTRTNAIVLETLTDIQPDHPFVSKLGNYLTTIRKKDGTYRNTQEAAFSLMALTEVVRTKEKDEPNFTAKVTLGTQEVASNEFKGRQMGTVSQHIDIDKLSGLSKQESLTFSKQGPGVLYYGALLRYAPAELPTEALDRGIVVQRWFEPFQGGDGQSTTFYAGDLVRVRVRVATSQEREFVAVDVPLPSGLEPVDTSLASTARLPSTKGEEGSGTGYEYENGDEQGESLDGEGEGEGDYSNMWANSFWSPFNFVETRDDRVVLFADRLPPGVHVTSFVARATTPGEYVLKAAQAEEMYTPEVFGRSDGGKFTVLSASK
jgi:uncharacterized protein YfaS (alpha-2-macroglobulin family)